MQRLSAAEIAQAMESGDFGDGVRASAPRVAVVLTQSWCPQWTMMLSWLEAAGREAEARVYYAEYDLESYFEPFMAFKEDVLGNRSVPYVRYYRDGALVAESNYLAKDGFVKRLRG